MRIKEKKKRKRKLLNGWCKWECSISWPRKSKPLYTCPTSHNTQHNFMWVGAHFVIDHFFINFLYKLTGFMLEVMGTRVPTESYVVVPLIFLTVKSSSYFDKVRGICKISYLGMLLQKKKYLKIHYIFKFGLIWSWKNLFGYLIEWIF